MRGQATPLLWLGGWLSQLLVWAAGAFAKLPGASVPVRSIGQVEAAAWALAGLALIFIDGQAQRPLMPIDWKQVDQGLGKPGALQPDGAYKVALPRGDLHVTAVGTYVTARLDYHTVIVVA